MSSGIYPKDSAEVNTLVGSLMRQFVQTKDMIERYQAWLAATDLKATPYNHVAGDETNLKTAVNAVNTLLQGTESAATMQWINRTTGLY